MPPRGLAPLFVVLVFFGGPVLVIAMAISARTAGYADSSEVVISRVRRFLPAAERAAASEGVPLPLLLAVASVESSGRPEARSHAGAVGLMQLMPATAADLASRAREPSPDLRDPATSLRLGARYLRELLDAFEGHDAAEALALCAYNAGPGAVRRWLAEEPVGPGETSLRGWVPYGETRAFVRRVREWREVWDAELRIAVPAR